MPTPTDCQYSKIESMRTSNNNTSIIYTHHLHMRTAWIVVQPRGASAQRQGRSPEHDRGDLHLPVVRTGTSDGEAADAVGTATDELDGRRYNGGGRGTTRRQHLYPAADGDELEEVAAPGRWRSEQYVAGCSQGRWRLERLQSPAP
jgi:hypothetical protein